MSRAEYYQKFSEHLRLAEDSRKHATTKLYHAQMAMLYLKLHEKAPL